LTEGILSSVLAATGRRLDAGRLDRFLAAHEPIEALRVWHDLDPGEPLPDKRALARRLWSA
jgi:hypothetical protein